MLVLSQKGTSPKKPLLGVHVSLILLSFSLVITNACQIGMIHQHAPVYSVEVMFYDKMIKTMYIARIQYWII